MVGMGEGGLSSMLKSKNKSSPFLLFPKGKQAKGKEVSVGMEWDGTARRLT